MTSGNLSVDELLAIPKEELAQLHFDQPELAVSLLKSLLLFNGDLLAATFNEPVLQLPEEISKCPLSLVDAIQLGMQNPPFARTIFTSVFHFLAVIQQKLPFFCLLDGVNHWYNDTQYRDMNGCPLTVARLPVVNLLKKYFEEPSRLSSSSFKVLASLSLADDPKSPLFVPFNDTIPHFLARIKNQLPFASQDPTATLSFQPTIIHLDNFSRIESFKLLKYYRSIGLLYEESLHGPYLDQKYFLTAGNPEKLFHAVLLDNLY